MINLITKYIIVTLSIILFLFTILWVEKESKINQHLNTKNNFSYQKYSTIYYKYKDIADMVFKVDINKPKILDIFQNAKDGTINEKEIIREQLFKQLNKTYLLLTKYNLKQLHFHLPNNDSFLRLHRPKKFGDNLTDIRDTVAYVNKNKKKIHGFEEGRIFNGYRFVYPLFNKKNIHIGSVEISFSTVAFNQSYQQSYNEPSSFLILKDVVKNKVFKDELSNYTQSSFDNYYIEKNTHNKNDYFHRKYKFERQTEETINNLKETTTIIDNNIPYLLTFIPIKNPITQKRVGVYIVKSHKTYIINKTKNFIIIWILLSFLIIWLAFLLYKKDIKKIQLDTIVNEAQSGISTMDLKGKFLTVNKMYTQLLGYTEKELLQLNCIELSKDKENATKFIQEAFKNNSISKVRKTCIRKDGKEIILEFSLTLLPSKNEFIAVVNSLEDKLQLEYLNTNLQVEVDNAIEEIRQKDQMLFAQSKTAALGEMIDAIAHQWKSPLGIIKLYAETVEMELDYTDTLDKKEIKKYIEKTKYQINHLITTIDEFRSFFRPSSKIEDTPINAVINSVKKLMKDELIKNNIELEIKGDETSIFKLASNEFKHVLINLFSNSKDAFNDNNIIKTRKIVIEIICDKNKKELKISDNAGGIPENILTDIFKPNFTTKEQGKGTGVGLYMSKQIVEKNLGSIEVHNIENGACFTISFIE